MKRTTIIWALCLAISLHEAQAAAGGSTDPQKTGQQADPDQSKQCTQDHVAAHHRLPATKRYKPKPKTEFKPEARNPLAINQTIAVADTPRPAIVLPGVMTIAGENRKAVDFTDVRYIDFKNLGSQTIYISTNQPNMIKLPFTNPAVIADKASVQVDKRKVSSNIYVTWTGQEPHPSQMFIEPPGGGGESLSLELVPKNIPSQTIIVTASVAPSANDPLKDQNNSSAYVTKIQEFMADVARGKTPFGMTRQNLDIPPLAKNGLILKPLRRYSGVNYDLYTYRITNPGKDIAHLHEQEFDGPDVAAVSIYPAPILKTNESGLLEVIARKPKEANQ